MAFVRQEEGESVQVDRQMAFTRQEEGESVQVDRQMAFTRQEEGESVRADRQMHGGYQVSPKGSYSWQSKTGDY
ncbi:hypothetical protein [Robertmurraya kyonggiensis]|uniref:Uncharacterized protein n=1 Tax=Robertmurraya kyonggiensis TaxID=1037680 RepID=A0A4V5P128_9BACI|nr:hypothetical protein [Robertmurraya kyonggiensis]TKC16030.1 hypothetical protein FA727_13810 [Robertmurraya kyonggiensis]